MDFVNIPKKISDMPFADFKKIMENPGAYSLTIGEAFEMAEYAAKMIQLANGDSQYKIECDRLANENMALRSEVNRLNEIIKHLVNG